MLKRSLKLLSGLVGAIATLIYIEQTLPEGVFYKSEDYGIETIIFSLVAFILFYSTTGILIKKAPRIADKIDSSIRIKVSSMYELVLGFIGSLCGLIVGTLMSVPVSKVPIIGIPVSIILNVLFAYIGYVVLIRYKNDRIFTKIREKYNNPLTDELGGKLLDTSVIIDGRICDIISAGFIEGALIVPNFVIDELKILSDSADDIKRSKGRRGLDIVADLKKDFGSVINCIDYNKKVDDVNGVDEKLIHIAKAESMTIITNDLNLNKVAQIQGVKVLNINDLSNALKPIAFVGEEIVVTIIKCGKERQQGIAYLDSGTMVVVENTKKLVGETVTASVTSVIQTQAGRMIFADLKAS